MCNILIFFLLSVKSKVREKTLSENKARIIFQKLMRGIAYCHSKKIYHRDIKAENVLVDPISLETKITDFGFSVIFSDDIKNDQMHTICGTLVYIAPEILENKGYYGPKADIWSCGVLLFLMIAGCKLKIFPF